MKNTCDLVKKRRVPSYPMLCMHQVVIVKVPRSCVVFSQEIPISIQKIKLKRSFI